MSGDVSGVTQADIVREQVLSAVRAIFGNDQVMETEDGICIVLSGSVVLVRVDAARLEVQS